MVGWCKRMVKGGEESQEGAGWLLWQGTKGGLNMCMVRAGGRISGKVGGKLQLLLHLVM